MLLFPNSKINIGLSILNRREDGYHNLESVFYPIPLFDSLEFIQSAEMTFDCSIEIDNEKSNSVLKAYELISKDFDLPPISIYLQKRIPMGAGLGGGSSNGASMLVGLNSYFNLGLSTHELEKYALQIGADCPFFVETKPKIVHGIGEILSESTISLSDKYICLVNPKIHISTEQAFGNLKLKDTPNPSLKKVIEELPISDWKNYVFNDFEKGIFDQFPKIETIKVTLYKLGATYASMTGTGSTVYGIFDSEPELDGLFDSYFTFTAKL
jgi:4-diphosphocytidyl-2-C-methyl-D-erythritol kinase